MSFVLSSETPCGRAESGIHFLERRIMILTAAAVLRLYRHRSRLPVSAFLQRALHWPSGLLLCANLLLIAADVVRRLSVTGPTRSLLH